MAAPLPRRSVPRPIPATLRPATAWLVSLYLAVDEDGFRAWMSANQRHLPVEAQLDLEDDLFGLQYVADWYRAHSAASDVGHADTARSDMPRGSSQDVVEMTTAMAAEELGMSSRNVLRLVDQRVLVGRKVNARTTMVTAASVNALKSVRAAS